MKTLIIFLMLVSIPFQASAKKQVARKWVYESRKQGIDDVEFKTATVKSKNSISLGFPLDGANYCYLIVRRWAGKEPEVIFYIDKGSFYGGIDDVQIKVKFDDRASELFTASRPKDISLDWIGLYDSKSFIEKLRESKSLKIEATLYSEGSHIFVFDVDGFDISKVE